MVTLRSLQRKRGSRNNQTKRVRTQRVRGGRPNRESSRNRSPSRTDSSSLSRSYSSIMREFVNLPVVTATPRPSETAEQRIARGKAREAAKIMLNTTYEKLKRSIKNNRMSIWMETWDETIKYEKTNRKKTLATDDGEEDYFFKPGGEWRSKMDHIKSIREYWDLWFDIKDKNVPEDSLNKLTYKINEIRAHSEGVYDKLFLGYFDDLLAEIEKATKGATEGATKGATKGKHKRTHKKKKPKKKKKTKGKRQTRGKKRTLLSYLF